MSSVLKFLTNPASQQQILSAINAVATIVSAMLALVTSISSKTAVARMASQSTIKLAQVRPYMDEGKAAVMVAGHYGEPVNLAAMQVAQLEVSAVHAGF